MKSNGKAGISGEPRKHEKFRAGAENKKAGDNGKIIKERCKKHEIRKETATKKNKHSFNQDGKRIKCSV